MTWRTAWDKHSARVPTCALNVAYAFYVVLGVLTQLSWADEPVVAKRPPWTTSRVEGSPEPPLPYVSERAFPALEFKMCVDMVTSPESERWFVVEQFGKILSFPKSNDVTQADLVIDFAKAIPGVEQVYSMAFHPNFKHNRYCYVCYIKAPNLEDGTHVARFKLLDTSPPTIDVASEETLVTWWSGGHNGCHLLFGPDGYLYISAGDANAANPPDIFKTGQDLSDIPASILRIDVDHADDGKSYRIPADNPFVNTPGTRGEIWAFGLRNPWRMSFDRKTRDLWCGDVGWEMWEMLHRIERGGNYGWSLTEAHQPINSELKPGPTPILRPVTVHPHTESTSITEGLTFYGKRLQELYGTHIYSDYDTGKFWGLRYEGGTVVSRIELADTTHRVVGFAEDNDGEFYFLDHTAGTIHRLVANPRMGESLNFPRTLSQTAIFESAAEQLPAPGVVGYSIQAEMWADGASSQRWVAIPNDQHIGSQSPNWSFPKNSVLVKSLMLETRRGDPTSRRRVETQLLHFDGTDWMPYAYQWNESQTDAALVGAAGAEQEFVIEESGSQRIQTWHFAGRAECQRCHNKYSGTVLGFNVPQLHREGAASQLDQFARMGLITNEVPREQRICLANPNDKSASLDARARAYLHVNCAHCHRMSAGGAVLSYIHFDLPLDKTNMLAAPSQGDFKMQNAKVIAPSEPFRSVLLYRMSKLGGGKMPRLGSAEIDSDGIALIADWISAMPPSEAVDANESVDQRAKYAKAFQQLTTESAPDAHASAIHDLLDSTSGALALQRALHAQTLTPAATALAVQYGAKHTVENVRDLFEQFLPPGERVKRLGSNVQPEAILAMSGDRQRGSKLFFETASVNCQNCHRITGVGKDVGPDLTLIGSKLSAFQMLESILEPSKTIDPKYRTHLIETKDGQVISGILVQQDEKHVVLRNAKNEEARLSTDEIQRMQPQSTSIMPEQLVRDLTPQQLADMLAFLDSLRKPE